MLYGLLVKFLDANVFKEIRDKLGTFIILASAMKGGKLAIFVTIWEVIDNIKPLPKFIILKHEKKN